MANITLTNLPTVTSLNGTEPLLGVQSSTSVQITTGQIVSLAKGSGGNLPFPVSIGGTGDTTFTPYALLYGNGTSPIGVVTPPAGADYVLVASSGSAPSWQPTIPVTAGVDSVSFGTTGLTPVAATAGVVSVAFGSVPTAAGIYSPASNQIALSTNSTRQLLIDSTGAATFTTSATSPLLIGTASRTSTATTGAFSYGTNSFSDVNVLASFQSSVNNYNQATVQNTSSGTASSAEFVAYNDLGTASTNYAAVGINSSGYTGTGSINAAGYGFFLTGSTDLVLGTIGSNAIHFVTNSASTDAMSISSAGVTTIANASITSLTTPTIYGGTTASSTLSLYSTSGAGTSDSIVFYTGSQVQAMRIGTNQTVVIGTGSAPTTSTLLINKNITGNAVSYSVLNNPAIQSDVTTAASMFLSNPSTAAASFTLTALRHFNTAQGTFGAGSTVTSQYGFVGGGDLIDATNNYGFFASNTAAVASTKTAYGFYSAINTATGGGTAWGFYGAGTANNAFLGNVAIGSVTAPVSPLTVTGNTTMLGTASRFLADFSNATVNSRYAFQTSTTNGSTGIYALPNGTSTAASVQAANSADPTNASKILIATNASTDVQLVSGINGTGTYLPLSFYTNGTQQMQLNTGSQLALGPNVTSPNSAQFYISGTPVGVIAATAYSVYANTTFPTTATNQYGFFSSINGTASSTTSNVYHFRSSDYTLGSGQTLTNQYAFFATTSTTATNNYGFYGNIASATNAWNLYMNGTASNYMAGALGVGTTSVGAAGSITTSGAVAVGTTVSATTVTATAGAGYQNMVVQTTGTAASYSLPAALQITNAKFKVTVVGGGGQGGGNAATAGLVGGGGGGGGVVVVYLTYVAGQNTLTYTVGPGGSGAGNNTAGTAGTASSIVYNSVTYTAGGGGGGPTGGTGGSGTGGTATGGTLNIVGQIGGAGGTEAATSNMLGDGGNVGLGLGYGARTPSTTGNGTAAASGYGGGGSGAWNGGTATARSGGAGAAGVVIIEY